MKYFTKELWHDTNHENRELRRIAEEKWKENCAAYAKEFTSVRKKLPRSLVRQLERYDFHDYTIRGIYLSFGEKSRKSKIVLEYHDELHILDLKGVQKINLNCIELNDLPLGELRWGYSEFLAMPDGTVSLSVVCDWDNEFRMDFQRIRYSIQRKRRELFPLRNGFFHNTCRWIKAKNPLH